MKLRQLEQDTDCRIMVPGRDSPSDIIKIIGPRDGIEKAVHEIQLVSDKQVKFGVFYGLIVVTSYLLYIVIITILTILFLFRYCSFY